MPPSSYFLTPTLALPLFLFVILVPYFHTVIAQPGPGQVSAQNYPRQPGQQAGNQAYPVQPGGQVYPQQPGSQNVPRQPGGSVNPQQPQQPSQQQAAGQIQQPGAPSYPQQPGQQQPIGQLQQPQQPQQPSYQSNQQQAQQSGQQSASQPQQPNQQNAAQPQPPSQPQQPAVPQQSSIGQGQPQTLPGTYKGPSADNQATCPGNDGSTYSATDGSYFMLRCNFHQWVGSVLERRSAASYQECIERCAARDDCKAVNYYLLAGNECALMATGGISPKAVSCANHHYAFTIDPPTQPASDDVAVMCSTECPYANHGTYASIFGTSYRMICGRRHGTPHIRSDTQATFKDCIDSCAGINGCLSVDYHERSKSCYYSDHLGYPTVEVKGYSSAWSVGCSGACGGCSCGSHLEPGKLPQLPKPMGPPVPDLSCGNRGLQYFITPNKNNQGGDITYNDNTYSAFDPAILKSRGPSASGDQPSSSINGVTSNVGITDSRTDIYGNKIPYGGMVAVNHRGYLFAQQSGVYKFNLPSSDDITILWVGQSAYRDYSRQTSNIIQPFVAGGAKPVTYTANLVQGTYYPLRIIWANGGGAGNFQFKITAPDGTALLDANSGASDYLVQFSCDGKSAPKYLPWGQE